MEYNFIVIFVFSSILKQIKDAGVINVILDCSIENTYIILKEFQQNNMMTKSFSYLITSLVSTV